MKYTLLSIFILITVSIHGQSANGKFDEISDFVQKSTVPFTMNDGTNLATDVYLPVTSDSLTITINLKGTKGTIEIIPRQTQYLIYDSINDEINPSPYQLPVLFTRTPYNKNSSFSLGAFIAMMGYAYAIQDMRGAFGSEGAYLPMYSDAWSKTPYHPDITHLLDTTSPSNSMHGNYHEDGYQSIVYITDSLQRISDIDHDGTIDTIMLSNGSVGMFGASALANSQYTAAAAHLINPQEDGLKSLFPIVGSANHHGVTMFQNGVYREAIVDGWIGNQLQRIVDASLNENDSGIEDTIHSFADYNLSTLEQALNLSLKTMIDSSIQGNLPGYYPNAPFRSSMDVSYAPVNNNGEGDINGDLSRFSNMDVPTYNLTGWWDIFIDGQINTFRQQRKHISPENENKELQKLVIGPWAHQTIGSLQTGDIIYPENVQDIIGFNMQEIEDIVNSTDDIFDSELFKWFRHTMNERQGLSNPKFIIPESNHWQQINETIQVRIPSSDYIRQFHNFMGYLGGISTLDSIPIEMVVNGDTSQTTYDFPALEEPLFHMSSTPQESIGEYFQNLPAVRLYIPGPVNDGVAQNLEVGNYWFSADDFPVENGISRERLFFHANQTINKRSPTTNEGSITYVHNPNDPVLTVGGGNMIISTPDDGRKSQGQINLADPDLVDLTLNHPGIIQFSSPPIVDSLSIVGIPKVNLFASSNPSDSKTTETNTDFFVRILDVYPNGSEYFVVEGAVNARARDYAKSIYDGEENTEAIFSNILNNEVFHFQFDMLPIAYTFGHDHRIKVLISSSNHPRYMSNPNIPLNDGDFFRWKPEIDFTYTFSGELVTPRESMNRVYFSPELNGNISLPVLGSYEFTSTQPQSILGYNIRGYPNPTTAILYITGDISGSAQLKLYSTAGKLLNQVICENNYKIDLSAYSKGVYLVEVLNNRNIKTLKIVKQ